ncbi:VOC family protein [Phaeobacter sp. J2-8]|uniref:VOC family protein n=1 Tax=Phaeobacter sp. J2-8 TaxID=2931394 RepID=UPI001FD45A5F|nr:VOC family protein [Phaeobacter sp. J2-8]
MMAYLEHANITVNDPRATAAVLHDLFGWHIRWEGEGLGGKGYTVHVGTDGSYLALYAPKDRMEGQTTRYTHLGALNHIGIVVDDLDAIEARVTSAGYVPINHADYEPGRRFYFEGPDGVEYEVVSYA